MIAYALVATAVYDHGVVGIYDSEAAARAAAEEVWLKTDGHHSFRIDVLEVGITYENVFQRVPYDDVEELFGPDWVHKERARRVISGVVPIETNDMTTSHED